ncbi:MAG: PspC domain-containing protein [Acidobacteria bacterium]|nr:PspC domain-containing protein [Acidobacteriota bacterium]
MIAGVCNGIAAYINVDPPFDRTGIHPPGESGVLRGDEGLRRRQGTGRMEAPFQAGYAPARRPLAVWLAQSLGGAGGVSSRNGPGAPPAVVAAGRGNGSGWTQSNQAWSFIFFLDAVIWLAVALVLIWLGAHHFPELHEAIRSIPGVAHEAAEDIRVWWRGM